MKQPPAGQDVAAAVGRGGQGSRQDLQTGGELVGRQDCATVSQDEGGENGKGRGRDGKRKMLTKKSGKRVPTSHTLTRPHLMFT